MRHIPVLDGVRGLAVLMVICFHVSQISTAAPGVAAKISVWGQTGVDLFFVLSGFLITGILLDSKGSQRFLINFYARRVLRIFPLYYGSLLVVFVLLPLAHVTPARPSGEAVWFWTYLQNIAMTFQQGFGAGVGHFWSLAVEEQYYLVWPFLVLAFDRRRLLWVIGGILALSLVARIILVSLGFSSFFFTLCRFDGLAMGSAVAILIRQPKGLAPYTRAALVTGPLMAILLGGVQIALSESHVGVIQVVRSILICTVFTCFLVLVLQKAMGQFAHSAVSMPPLRSAGKYSYAMYVFHPFILQALVSSGVAYGPLLLASGIACTYIAAWSSWHLYEKHFLRLKKRFEYARPAQPQAQAAPELTRA